MMMPTYRFRFLRILVSAYTAQWHGAWVGGGDGRIHRVHGIHQHMRRQMQHVAAREGVKNSAATGVFVDESQSLRV